MFRTFMFIPKLNAAPLLLFPQNISRANKKFQFVLYSYKTPLKRICHLFLCRLPVLILMIIIVLWIRSVTVAGSMNTKQSEKYGTVASTLLRWKCYFIPFPQRIK